MIFRPMARLFAAAVATLLLAPSAQAQLFRAYLASTGSDANPCTIVAPCRLLPAAVTAVASGGEIWMLDSANFNTGTVNITKSVSILAVPGALGSIVGTGGTPALSLAAPVGTTKVSLRNLRIVPIATSPGNIGITMLGAVELAIEGSVIAGFTVNGIHAIGGMLRISDTIVRDNGVNGVRVDDGGWATLSRVVVSRNSNGVIAVGANTTPVSTRISIADSTIEFNQIGVIANSNVAGSHVEMAVRSSMVDRNANYGIAAQSFGGAEVKLVAHGNSASGNQVGINATGTGVSVTAGANLISGNNFGLAQGAGAVLTSLGTNTLAGNVNPTNGAITPGVPQ